MKRLGFLSILFTLVLACQKDYNKTKQPYKLIPTETSAIIQVNELNDFVTSIENNDVLSGLYNIELKNASLFLNQLNTTQQVYISFTDSNYLILTENDSTLFVLDSIKNITSTTLVDLNIEKTEINNNIIYHKIIGNAFAGSNDLELLKTLNTDNENTEISNLIETTDKKSVASILFKPEATNYSKLLFSDVINKAGRNFTILDFDYSEKGLNYNGILTSKDSSANHLDSFKNTVPQKTNSPFIAPYNTSSLVSITYDNFSVFNKNNYHLKDSLVDVSETFLNFTDEIALIDDVLVLHSLDPNLIIESIEDKSISESFRDIDIYEFGQPDFFETNLIPFITFENANFFSVFENFIVFSSASETLKSILTDALNNNTLANSDAFLSISEKLSDEASLFIFKDSEKLSTVLDQTMNGYNANAVQFIREDNYTHINGIIQKFKKRAASNSVAETFTTPLEATLLTAPQAVKNHVSKAHDIVVQDVNNMLYLISSSGNIL